MRDPEPSPAVVLEPVEVLEVAAVPDHAHGPARAKLRHLLGDRVRDADDRVGPPRDEAAERPLATHLVPPVDVLDERIAEVGDPASGGRPPDRGADEVNRSGRRGRQHDVDREPAHEPDRSRDRGQVPEHGCVGHESRARRELGT